MASSRKSEPRARRLNLTGRDVESYGLQTDFWSDIAHRSLTARWPHFVAGALGAFLALNGLFAALYTLGDRPVANSPGDFWNNFFFSIETLTTVGYGDMHPQTQYGHIVASVELFTGVFTTAILTGLVFYRFSRPRARILFAERAVIAKHDGRRSLMIRAANERLNAISGPRAQAWLAVTVPTAEGASFRRFGELRLLRSQSPLFVLSWTIIHPIDEASPLFGMDEAALEAVEGAVIVTIEGYDESSAQTVRTRKTYLSSNIVFGHRYVDVLEPSDGARVRLNYGKFHLTEPDA